MVSIFVLDPETAGSAAIGVFTKKPKQNAAPITLKSESPKPTNNKEGMVKPDDSLVHMSSHPSKISVMHVNQIRYHDSKNKAELERLANLKELTLEWQELFEVMLRKLS